MENITTVDQTDELNEISAETIETTHKTYMSVMKRFFSNLFSTSSKIDFSNEDDEPDIEDYTNEERLDELESSYMVLSDYALSLAENMDDYLYVEGESPLEEFNREVEEFQEGHDENPAFYGLFRKGVDPETLAFFNLSEVSKQRLLN